MFNESAIRELSELRVGYPNARAALLPYLTDKALDNFSVMLTNNFEGKSAYRLMGYDIEPVTRSPVLDGNTVAIEKAGL